jgi:hypothetical protein
MPKVPQLVKKAPESYWKRMKTSMYTTTRHMSQIQAKLITHKSSHNIKVLL